MYTLSIYVQCFKYGETGLLIYNQNVWKTPLKSDILLENTGHWPLSLLKCRFSAGVFQILLVQINYLVSP